MKKMFKFHESYKYVDDMNATVEGNYSLIDGNIMGAIKITHPSYPTIMSILGPFNPDGPNEIEDELLKKQSKNEIRNLTFGNLICINTDCDVCQEVSLN